MGGKRLKDDDWDPDEKAKKQQEDMYRAVHKVYIEREKDRLYFTNSCWEVQKLHPF